MRGAILIKFEDHLILKNHLSTLHETSVDFHDKNHIQYMTKSERTAVNFDDVKEEYIKKSFTYRSAEVKRCLVYVKR